MSPGPELENGTYMIYNRVLNTQGQRLAITFNGDQQPMTVTPVELYDLKQRWKIEKRGNDIPGVHPYRFRPEESPGLEAGWGKTIYTVPITLNRWSVRIDESGAIIQDCGKKISWSINSATNGAEVVSIGDATGEKQRWIFHRVIEDALPGVVVLRERM